MNDTIFAAATAAGRAAVAVVRLSGPGTRQALGRLAGGVPPPRRASLRALRHDGEEIDRALVLWFPGPASYTGEDCAELQVHGGGAVLRRLAGALAALGLRAAAPGEFTRRAFAHGKLDLAQAEGVADLVDADTEAQRRQALRQLEGALGARHAAWRELLIAAMAPLEAAVDFPDEELPADVTARAAPLMRRLLAELEAATSAAARGRQVREGFRIALVGAPNAGKSTLFNGLVEREAAIVTATPGTTRDIIEQALEWAGYKVILGDMAGLRASRDLIEQEGVRRATAWAEAADLRVWLVDGAADTPGEPVARELLRPGDLCLLNKADLPEGRAAVAAAEEAEAAGLELHRLSARDVGQVSALRQALTGRLTAAGQDAFPAATRARHLEALEDAKGYLARALAASEIELVAEDLRLAARALDRVSGRIDPEQVLDRVFASFCIGK